ncbi:MAG: TlpA family protein disulfide reductase [Candidatus Eremiobacteraeota bacterium]|nr:TlpA family protein disulfide reductase [Candidatus Eremiobacteraeota bacterium]
MKGQPSGARRLASRAVDLLAFSLIVLALYRLFVAPSVFNRPLARAPEFSLAALDGGVERLGAKSGRVVFVDFWASWCGPCKVTLPLVERFARTHPDVDVIAVDVGEDTAVATAYARAEHLRRVAFDPDERVYHAFGGGALPTMVVVDPQGFVRKTWIGVNPAIELAMDAARKKLSAP